MEELIAKHAQRGIVIDTNILLLLVVGSIDRNFVSEYKRTATFTPDDFDLLETIVSFFRCIITTPHVLTEVSNLTEGIKGVRRDEMLDRFISWMSKWQEEYTPTAGLAQAPIFRRLGVADSAVAALGERDWLVLTDDLSLYLHLANAGHDVINFNHLRRF